jgi:hypothetical protein
MNETRVSYFFDEFNAFHGNFQLTIEIEQGGFLPSSLRWWESFD